MLLIFIHWRFQRTIHNLRISTRKSWHDEDMCIQKTITKLLGLTPKVPDTQHNIDTLGVLEPLLLQLEVPGICLHARIPFPHACKWVSTHQNLGLRVRRVGWDLIFRVWKLCSSRTKTSFKRRLPTFVLRQQTDLNAWYILMQIHEKFKVLYKKWVIISGLRPS